MNRVPRKHIRWAFSLVELVVVILILGIIAAVAAPCLFDSAGDARTNSTRHSLAVIRDAIQLFREQNGALPGDLGTEADFQNDVETMLTTPFPRAEVGNVGTTVRVQTTGAALAVSGAQSWAYDNISGEFVVNHATGFSW